MAYTAYATYYTYIRDDAEYDAAIAIFGAGFVNINPNALAAALGIPFSPFETDLEDKGIVFFHPWIPTLEIFHPLATGIFLDAGIDSFLVPGQFGGQDMNLVWSTTIVHIGATTGASPSPDTPIPQRRWGMGFELAVVGEGGSGLSPAQCGCRDASRTIEGAGWAFRNQTGVQLTRTLDEYQVGLTSVRSWERIYIRLRVLPSVNAQVLKTTGAISGNAGLRLVVNTTGTLSIINVNAANATTLTGTSVTTLLVNEWHKIDLLIRYNDGTNNGLGRMYIDGVLEVTLPVLIGSGGLGQAQNHLNTILGDASGGGVNGLEIDFDDWENSEFPMLLGVESLLSLDWLTGSHYRKVWVESAGAGNANWTPTNVQTMNQMISPLASSASSRYSSSTALARLHGITDATDEINDITGFNLGAIAAVIGLYASRNGVADGQLGYSINGVVTMANIVQNVATIFNSRMYRPTGLTLPDPIIPFGVVHDKANSGDSSLVLGLQGVIGYIGTWGIEDDPEFVTYNLTPVIHNAPYFNTVWGFSGPPPDAPAVSFGRTYVGNGTEQTIELLLPIHFLWIRPLTGGAGGVKWHSTGMGAHFGGSDRVVPDYVVRVYVDQVDGVTKFTVTGNDSQVNASGVTYQWIAFADPAMRFCLNGAFRHNTALASFSNPLIDLTFNPTWLWTQSDNLNQAGSTVISACKGPGDGANVGTELDGTTLANYATLAAGAITSRAALHLNSGQINFSAWRTSDGSGEVAVQILTYTGDGAGSRNIALTPVSLRFPLFAYVQPANAQGFYRDPSHVGTASSNFDSSATSATAITAGAVDQITVGITLNAGGIVYNVFVLPGDDTGWTNGDFPIPSDPPPDDVWPEDPHPGPDGITIIGDGGIIFDGTPSLLLLASISGIYTLVEGKTNDTLIDRQPLQPEIDVKIPDPIWKTGYVGG